MLYKIIAVDFDGTLCENMWPHIGAPNHELIKYLKAERGLGNKVILWTCRTSERLEAAVNWCKDWGLIFDAVNENLPEAVEKYGEDSRKIFAHEYIDDRANTRFKLPYVRELRQDIFSELNLDVDLFEKAMRANLLLQQPLPFEEEKHE